MNSEERLITLERELADTRRAAAGLMLGMVDAIVSTPFQREELAVPWTTRPRMRTQ